MSSQPSSTSTLLGQGFFYYFHFFLEQYLICITAYLVIISRVTVAQMSNAKIRNMRMMNSLKIFSSEILLELLLGVAWEGDA